MTLNWKKIISSFLVVASIVVVIWIAFSNSELENAWEALGSMKLNWVLGILACWFLYMFMDSMGYWLYFRGEGFRIPIHRMVIASLIGFYYSNITPSSAGGQPMQINSLRKAGIPVAYGTIAATIRFASVQFCVSLISLLFWIANRSFVYQQLGDVIWLIRLGWLINFAGVPLVLMAAFQRKLIQRIAMGLISFATKIHLIKNREAAAASVTNVLDTYHHSLRELLKKPSQIVLQVVCSLGGGMALFGSVYFVYHAFGLAGTPWYQLVTVSALLYVSASYTPLPGASGAQEGGFLLYFRDIFPGDRIGLALLVWRFFTYYIFLIVGMFTVILEKVLVARQQPAARK